MRQRSLKSVLPRSGTVGIPIAFISMTRLRAGQGIYAILWEAKIDRWAPRIVSANQCHCQPKINIHLEDSMICRTRRMNIVSVRGRNETGA